MKKTFKLSDIDTSEWKEFKVSDIFINKNVKKYSKSPKEEGLIPFVTSTSTNNGISCYCNLENVCKGNCITVSTNGRCFDCFYQPIDFAVSSDCEVLYPREEYEHFLNEYNAIFITTILSLNRSKYGYSNKPKNGIVWKTVISLPVDSNGQPDWEYMEKTIKELEKIIKEELLKSIPEFSDIDTSEWKEFKVSDIFINKNVKKYSKSPKEEGLIPFVTSTSTNNGISCYCNLENVCKGNCITVSTNGRCFDCFYQPIDFAVSSDCEVLYPREEYEHFLNEYNAIFITTILSLNRSKYGYSNKPKNGIVWKTVISLPVDSNGQPDWEYMEKYIKNQL